MVVAHNLSAMNSQRQYGITRSSRAKSTEKLSSGYRINRSADDASGLAISEKLRRQIRGFNQGASNIRDGISMVQVADGALNEVHDMLNRMTQLSVQAANDTMTPADRSYLQGEVTALVNEIQRVADTTTFNELLLFNDPDYYDPLDQSITKLLHCDSADYGKLHEAYHSSNGLYYPAAYVNFSGITAANIDLLNGGNFTFICGKGCGETFDITFTTDGTPSSNKNLNGRVHHYYSVDISGCTSGAEIVDRIYNYIAANPVNSSLDGDITLTEGIQVSHTNNLIKSGSSLIVAANYQGKGTEAAAIAAFEKVSGNRAGITCSTIESEKHDFFRPINIQCSSNIPDSEEVIIWRMNKNVLGLEGIGILSPNGARKAIDAIKNASAKISFQRSELGAQQNRLEHTLNTNLNTAENLTAADSLIRDTDMAKEAVRNNLLQILEQAGVSMMAQANQSNQNVLSLLS